jgi:hypothetical protein
LIKAPENCYRNSLTLINSNYNKSGFNDGYHIGHHLNPMRHWSDHPQEFIDNMETYQKEGAVVMEGIDFLGVWALLMAKNYKALAKRYVPLDNQLKTEEEVIAFLKERIKLIPKG